MTTINIADSNTAGSEILVLEASAVWSKEHEHTVSGMQNINICK